MTNANSTPQIEWTIERWIKAFGQLYEKADQGKSSLKIWMHVFDDAAELAEMIRRGDVVGAQKKIPHIFCWYCCFIYKYIKEATLSTDYNISKWILEKYPKICPVCGQKRCRCPSFRDEAEERKKVGTLEDWQVHGKVCKWVALEAVKEENAIGDGAKQTVFLETFVEMFQKIYGGTHYDQTPGAICFHLLEEIGEVTHLLVWIDDLKSIQDTEKEDIATKIKTILKDCEPQLPEHLDIIVPNWRETSLEKMKQYFEDDLHMELADVFSWLTAMASKLNQSIASMTGPARDEASASDVKGVGESVNATNPDDHTRVKSFSHLLTEVYGSNNSEILHCPHCKKTECSNDCILTNMFIKQLKDEFRQEFQKSCTKMEKDKLPMISEPDWDIFYKIDPSVETKVSKVQRKSGKKKFFAHG